MRLDDRVHLGILFDYFHSSFHSHTIWDSDMCYVCPTWLCLKKVYRFPLCRGAISDVQKKSYPNLFCSDMCAGAKLLHAVLYTSIYMEHSPLEKLTVVEIFHTLYGTQMFVTMFTRAVKWFQSWISWIHSTVGHLSHIRYTLILSSRLRLLS